MKLGPYFKEFILYFAEHKHPKTHYMYQQIKYIITQAKVLFSKFFDRYDGKLPYLITVGVAVLVVIGGINLFVELTENLHTEVLATYDSAITDYVVSFRAPYLTQYFVAVTHIGDVYGYLAALIICISLFLLVFKNWKFVLQLGVVMVLALSSNVILKKVINRSRPEIEHLVTVETLSYPSGHAMTAMAFYGFLIYLFYRFDINKLLKYSVILLLTILIISIGISRIYLGVHFPSDVVGGFIAGFIWVVFCALIFNLFRVFRYDPET